MLKFQKQLFRKLISSIKGASSQNEFKTTKITLHISLLKTAAKRPLAQNRHHIDVMKKKEKIS